MRYFIILLIAFLAVIFQSSFLINFAIFGYVINLVLILAVGLAIFRNFKEGLFFAFFAGLFLDFFSAGFFGLEMFSLIFCVFLLRLILKVFKLPNPTKFLIFLPITLIFYEVLTKFLLWANLAIIK